MCCMLDIMLFIIRQSLQEDAPPTLSAGTPSLSTQMACEVGVSVLVRAQCLPSKVSLQILRCRTTVNLFERCRTLLGNRVATATIRCVGALSGVIDVHRVLDGSFGGDLESGSSGNIQCMS